MDTPSGKLLFDNYQSWPVPLNETRDFSRIETVVLTFVIFCLECLKLNSRTHVVSETNTASEHCGVKVVRLGKVKL